MKITGWIIFSLGALLLSPDYYGKESSEILFLGLKFFFGIVTLLVGNALSTGEKA